MADSNETTSQELHLEVEGRRVRLAPGERATVGRGADSDITLNHPDVSRRHALVRHDGASWVVHDLDSSNGTLVDGTRVRGQRELHGGETILFGGSKGVPARVGIAGTTRRRPDGETTGATYLAQGGLGAAFEEATGALPVARDVTTGRAAEEQDDDGADAIAAAGEGTGGGSTSSSGWSASSAADGEPMTMATPQGSAGASPSRPAKESSASPATGSGPVRLPRRATAPAQRSATGDVFHSWSGHVEAPATGQFTVSGAAPRAIDAPKGTITIGRGLDNEIVLKDLLASRRHARLIPQGGGYVVEDLGSSNGTYVNGQRITRAALREDDLLAVGHSRFTLKHGRLVASEDEGDVTFVANHLTFTLPDGKKLIDDVSFGLEGSSLVAVIGPSGAGKSTLLKALIGAQKATEGEVYYDGRDLYDNFDDLRHRIGLVPQDDVVHAQLTVRQALRYAAELRFPSDLDKGARDDRVEEVIDELGLTEHAETQVARLSGGQRKRTSVALELLTSPSLLFLDEPTSGLDPGLDKRVMETLRDLADGGRTVVVITHNVASLGICDRVLLLAPGGKVAYFGPPDQMLGFFDAGDHADIFNIVTDNPDKAQRTFRDSPLMDSEVEGPLSAPRSTAPQVEERVERRQSMRRQLSTLVRRQVRVLASDRGLMMFSLLMPFVLGGLILLVPNGPFGDGLRDVSDHLPAKDLAKPVTASSQSLTLMIMGAMFMGLSATVRELVGERAIFMREKAVGLSSFAYLGAKILTFGALLAVQCGILVAIVVAVKHSPNHAVLLGSPILELFLAAYLTGLASLALGLTLSSFAKTNDQVMPMLVIAVMAALVFSGGLFPLESSPLRWLASVSPSRWGLLMGAQTANVKHALRQANDVGDPTWVIKKAWWAYALAALVAQFVVFFVIAWIRTRRRRTV